MGNEQTGTEEHRIAAPRIPENSYSNPDHPMSDEVRAATRRADTTTPIATPEEDEPSAEERIDNAIQAASETQPSWKARCYRILGALGTDFGDNDDPDDFAEALSTSAAENERLTRERDAARAAMSEDTRSLWDQGMYHVRVAVTERRRAEAAEARVATLTAEVGRMREAGRDVAAALDDFMVASVDGLTFGAVMDLNEARKKFRAALSPEPEAKD